MIVFALNSRVVACIPLQAADLRLRENLPMFQPLTNASNFAWVLIGRIARREHIRLISALSLAWIASSGFAQSELAKPPVSQHDVWYEAYRFRNGETLDHLHLHYATMGAPHRDAKGEVDNAVLVLHWTGNSGASMLTPEYKAELYGQGRPLDATRYFLIVPDNVGHGASSRPSDGLRTSFPHYGYEDMVDLQHKLVTETLGIKHLRAILGTSMGGMNAWQWAERYPDAMDGIMPVVAFPTKVTGRNLLWRRIVVDEIRSDPDWNGGHYAKEPSAYFQAYRLLRMMIDGVPHQQVLITGKAAAETYLESIDRQVASYDANDLLYSLESSADYDPEPALASVKTDVFALNFADDEFNPNQLGILEKLIVRVPKARFVVQAGTPQSFGHLTMAHPHLWSDHVAFFMRSLPHR